MKLRQRTTEKEPQVQPAASPSDQPPAPDSRNVLVTHGVHRGRFPIGGMAIREARQVLARLINIEPSAVPVINGSPVDEEQVLTEDVSMLSFVKPSSLKG